MSTGPSFKQINDMRIKIHNELERELLLTMHTPTVSALLMVNYLSVPQVVLVVLLYVFSLDVFCIISMRAV